MRFSRMNFAWAVSIALSVAVCGCSPWRHAIPASCIQPNVFDRPRGDKQPIDFTQLRQEPPPVYQLGARDVLGIYVEGVLGKIDDAPPVYYPERGDAPPGIGFPIPIREDGTVSLPLVPPIDVAGLSVAQAEDEIRKAYTVDQKILQPGRDRIIVTLMRPRTYNVLVVREDTANIQSNYNTSYLTQRGGMYEPLKIGISKSIQLPAYENDVLHALAESGGLPGVEAKNELRILKGAFRDAQERDHYLRTLEYPLARAEVLNTGRKVQRIPLRVGPGDPPLKINPNDIILENGDIVFIESRDSEVFYTGGLLRGGQFPVPRDYDLDVLGAIAMSGGSVAAAIGSGAGTQVGGGRNSSGWLIPPSRVVVLRNVNGEQTAIKLSLKRALVCPEDRILVQPNDFILLEYTPMELIVNILLNNVNLNVDVNDVWRSGR